MQIGVVLFGELSVRRLYLFRARFLVDAQNLIIILFRLCHNSVCSVNILFNAFLLSSNSVFRRRANKDSKFVLILINRQRLSLFPFPARRVSPPNAHNADASKRELIARLPHFSLIFRYNARFVLQTHSCIRSRALSERTPFKLPALAWE